MEKNIKIFRCDKAGKDKNLKENCTNSFEETKLEYM